MFHLEEVSDAFPGSRSMPLTGAGKRFVGMVTSTDDMTTVSPIFTIPWGWNVRKRIGTDDTSFHASRA